MIYLEQVNEFIITGLLGVIAWQNKNLKPFLMANEKALTKITNFLKKVNVFD